MASTTTTSPKGIPTEVEILDASLHGGEPPTSESILDSSHRSSFQRSDHSSSSNHRRRNHPPRRSNSRHEAQVLSKSSHHNSSHHRRSKNNARNEPSLPKRSKSMNAKLPMGSGGGSGSGGPSQAVNQQPSSNFPNLYSSKWGQDSLQEMEVDPAIYDVDYGDDDDNNSDAASEFTEDYSRHKLAELIDGLGFENDGDMDDDDDGDESSLSSAGSFAEGDENDAYDYDYDDDNDDDWSDSSSAADSRKLHHQHQQEAEYEDHLLQEDPSEFSIEEDPLFNASGALKWLQMPTAAKVVVTKKDNDDDDDEEEEVWSDENDPNESFISTQVWKEDDDGTFVPERPPSSHHSSLSSSRRRRQRRQKASSRHESSITRTSTQRQSYHREASSKSIKTDSSAESFATDHTPTPDDQRKSKGKISTKEKHRNRTQEAASNRAPVPMAYLPQDPRMRIDDSDEELGDQQDEVESIQPGTDEAIPAFDEVLIFSDDEAPDKDHNAKMPMVAKGTISPNPIVPTSKGELHRSQALMESLLDGGILNQSAPTGQWHNVPSNVSNNNADANALHYSMDFTKIRLSPIEHRAPLKDHSRRPRKHKSRDVNNNEGSHPKKSSSTKKKKSSSTKSKSSKTSSRSLGNGKALGRTVDEEFEVESVTSITADSLSSSDDDNDEDVSIASEESHDSMDAAVGGGGKRKQQQSKLTKEELRKAKKAAKKKRKKEKVRKRGRRADFEENSDEDGLVPTTAHGAVAERVEAIFSDKQKIFDTTLHGEQQEKEGTRGPDVEDESDVMLLPAASFDSAAIPRHSESKPQRMRVRSKAAEAAEGSGGGNRGPTRNQPSNEKHRRSRSKSKSRSRSLSKDRSKPHGRSRSKSKDPKSVSKSRSKSVDKSDGGGRGKSRTRSKSVDKSPKSENTSTPVRRRLRKDELKSRDGNGGANDAASVHTAQTAPNPSSGHSPPKLGSLDMKLSMLNDDKPQNSMVDSSDGFLDAATMVSAPVPEPTTSSPEKVRRTPKRSKSMSKPKPEKSTRTRSPKSKSRAPSKRLNNDQSSKLTQDPSPANAMTLIDVIDHDGDSSVEGKPSKERQNKETRASFSNRELDISASSIHADDRPVPVDNTNFVRIKIQRLQSKIAEVEHRTKDELEMMKKDLDKRKQAIEEKVMKEMEKHNAVEAILCLHKIVVNDFHDSGRLLKKEIKSIERDMSRELAHAAELTRESIDWQSKTSALMATIQRLEFEKMHQFRALEQCKAEHRELSKGARQDHDYASNVIIGDFDDYGLLTTKPLYAEYRDPTPPPVSQDVLMASYALPKSSIFYNVLDDNDNKLTFTR